MTYARSDIVKPDEVGVYHCTSRCVRRAFLCGRDHYTGRSFEHRRVWVRNRLKLLVEVFAIEVLAYAIMSNHLHSLLRLRPDLAKQWSAREVAIRWRTLFPQGRDENGKPLKPSEEQISAIAGDPKKVEMYRERLSSLSWFHRCLNENIARRANREDECKGRFWEGRFRSQRVYDIGAILACAAYIDLNPIRAHMTSTLEGSDHTSIQDKVHEAKGMRPKQCTSWARIPLVPVEDFTSGMLTTEQYIPLLEETAKAIKAHGTNIPDSLFPALARLKIKPESWVSTTKHMSRKFKRVIGSVQSLEQAAQQLGKCWFQGHASAARSFA